MVVVVVEHYKAVVVFSLLRVVEWTGPPDPVICGKNWCKMRYYQPGGGAGTGVFSQSALMGGFKCTQPDNQLKNT